MLCFCNTLIDHAFKTTCWHLALKRSSTCAEARAMPFGLSTDNRAIKHQVRFPLFFPDLKLCPHSVYSQGF